jgi:class 3 adenylate cyclase
MRILPLPMTQLRTTVLMKTDIAGSTPQFRALLASDLQAALSAHRAMVTRLAGEEGGRIFKAAGDGYWLEFPSVTSAARSAIAMHEGLALTQSSKGRDRLSMRIVVGLGDTATQDGDLVGEVLALITRIEAITPPNEIYLTAAACLALTQSEIQTAMVDSFALDGFVDPVPVHRVAHRHRTHVLADACILLSDIRGFHRFTEVEAASRIERVLDTLDLLVGVATREFAGTVRSSIGDEHCITFPDASRAMSAAERLGRDWAAASREQRFDLSINICMHRGTFYAFRSFLYGSGLLGAHEALGASIRRLKGNEGSILVTSAMQESLQGSPWHGRLELLFSDLALTRFPELKVFRLKSEQ